MSILAKLTDLVENHPQTQEDFNRRFHETYLVYKHNDDPEEIMYCDGVRGNQIRLYRDKEQLVVVDGFDKRDILRPFLPKVGYYNTPSGPVYLYKTPRKQYRRSFCNGIYTATGPKRNEDLVQRVNWNNLAQTCLKQEYVHLDDITSKLFANIAINREFVITANKSGISTLLYKRYEIAQLDFNLRTIRIIQPKLQQEIWDYFKYNGVKTWKLK